MAKKKSKVFHTPVTTVQVAQLCNLASWARCTNSKVAVFAANLHFEVAQRTVEKAARLLT